MSGNKFPLYSKDIPSIGEANALFGADKGLLVIRPGRSILPFFSIPDGCCARLPLHLCTHS